MLIGFRKRDAADHEFDGLPEPIIHVVQSFLSSKEAARTTLVSKSWQTAWLTYPNLDFDQENFGPPQHGYDVEAMFLEFSGKTLERYENSNLNIESFRLSMKHPGDRGSGPATELVRRALKLGPTRLTFEFQDSDFQIPDEVFRYENLISLTAEGCTIFNLNREVCCSRLQFLCFTRVGIESGGTLFHILSICPLIEKLSLSHVYVSDSYAGESVFCDTTTALRNFKLCRLTSLVLNNVHKYKTLFLADLSSKLPSLKDLTLYICYGREEVLISSLTLERLYINTDVEQYTSIRYPPSTVKLDVPSFRKLTLQCSTIPKLSVRTNSLGWESEVSVKRTRRLSASWFNRLSNLIKKLRFSRISLSLHVYSPKTFHYKGGEIRGLPTPEIENLDVNYHELLPTTSCYVLFDGLFRICRPKVITPYISSGEYDLQERNNNIYFLGKRLLEARDAIPTQFMYGLNDLKEARAQVFDEDAVSTWRDVTLESLLDDSTQEADEDSTVNEEGYYPDFRFLLNWKQ